MNEGLILTPPPQPSARGGGRGEVGSPENGTQIRIGPTLVGLGILCGGIPLLRDLVVRPKPGSVAVVAAIGYGAVLAACYISMRATRMPWAEIGIRALSPRSIVLGIITGLLVIAPVWRLPVISVSRGAWLLVAVAVEEVVFRGVLFAILRKAGGIPLAIGGSALAFTVAHAASAGGPSLILVALAGLFLGLLRAIRSDLWTPGFAHLVMDLVSLP